MIIINCWQQVSRRYLISHLFLSVMAAGFGFITNTVAISSAPVNATVTIITIAIIAKVNLQDGLHSITEVSKRQWLFSAQRKERLKAITYLSSYLIDCDLLPIKGYFFANAIRAGPNI